MFTLSQQMLIEHVQSGEKKPWLMSTDTTDPTKHNKHACWCLSVQCELVFKTFKNDLMFKVI